MSGARIRQRRQRPGRYGSGIGWLTTWLLLSVGCQGEILTPPDGAGAGAGAAPGAGGSDYTPGPDGPSRPPDEAGYGDDEGGLYDRPAPATRLSRLTHSQWENSVRDLLRIPEGIDLPADFRPDPTQQGFLFSNDASALSVDDSLWTGYQRSAAEVAELVFADADLLADVLSSAAGSGEARARAFIEDFGRRAHRQPLTTEQIDSYLQLYRDGIGAYAGMPDFESGIRLVVEAILQSPFFLYRVEASSEVVGEVIPLDSYEIASRLSYMLWDTMPDAELFALAEGGELVQADRVAAAATRMLEDPRAERVIQRFHEQLLDLERYGSIAPAPAFYPDAPDDLAGLAATETELFVRETVARRGGSYRDLLLSPETFVNADLAPLYGLESSNFGEDFEPATLDDSVRLGLLTQIGFLASHATSAQPDPIHRGVFIAKRVSCINISAPPEDIPPLPPTQGRTNRETIEDHTQQEGTVCANCHTSLINPFGFAFENYDSTGAYRTMDDGHVVDASASPLIDGVATPVNGAVELVRALADSEAVHDCYARHWLEFAYGRKEHPLDQSLLTRLGARSAEDDVSVKEIIIGLVKTDAFLTRSTEEVP